MRQVLSDDLDMRGHHIKDWRYLSDIPQGGAITGQVMLWSGTEWTPSTLSLTDTGLVNSVFGRDGDVVAAAGDYTVDQVSDANSNVDVEWFNTAMHVRDLHLVKQDIGSYITLSFDYPAYTPLAYLRYNYDEDWLECSPMLKGTLFWATTHMITNAVRESTADAGVTVDDMLIKDGVPYADTISEATAAAGVTVDGVKLKDSEVYTDTIVEKTATAGVTVDGVKLKDSEVYTDVVREKTSAAGVTVDGVLCKDNGVTSAWTSVGTSRTNVVSSIAHTTSGVEFGTTYRNIDATLAVTAASGTTSFQTYNLLNLSATVTSGTPTFFQPTLHVIASTVNAGGLTVASGGGVSTQPVHFIFTNPSSAQAFNEGYLSVDVTGTTGDVIAAFTRARVSGAASGIGYRGYAVDASGSTGTITGVNGYAVIVTGSTSSAVMAFDATIIGTAVAYDKRMSFRGSNHVLIRGGSLFLASGTPATPNAVTTTHLTPGSANSELYVAGAAEVDGELFMDGNTSISVVTTTATSYNASTATVIRANAASANITVNLPAASGRTGRVYIVKKVDSSANTVTIDANASETIDGATTVVLTTQYEVQRLVCNGTNWDLV